MKTKRFLSILLSLVLVLGMLPGMSLTAFADNNTTTITPGTDDAKTGTGTMTITLKIKAAQTITASDVTATYGDTDKSVSASVTTPATGGGAISYTVKDGSGDYIGVASDGKLTINKVPPTDGKAYVIVTAAATDDYAETTKEVTVTISKAEATVAAKDQGIMVGGTVPDLSAPVLDTHYSVTGLIGTDTLTTAPTLAYQKNGSTATPDNTTAGTYDIVPSGASAGDNYNISYTNGTLTITAKDTQTITASDVNATYGDTDKSVSATTDGNGEISYTVKAGSENYIDVNTSTGALTIKAVPADGKAYVTVTAAETTTGGTGDKGYAAATKDVTVNISKATVTIAAKDQSIYVGGTVPTLSGTDFYTVTGLVGEETLTTNPTLAYQKNGSAVTPDNTTAGTYDIVPSGAVASDNYSISYTNGTLTISSKGTQTITAENVTATYGDTDKSVSATVTDPATGGGAISYAVKEGSGDYIEVNASTGALTIKKAGTATVIVTAAETATYAQAAKEVTVTINKANAAPATVTANTLTYTGSAQALVTVTGEPTGGEMRYAVTTENTAPTDENLYTTSIPTKTDVGTYFVWYKVAGDENHNDTNPACVEVTINKATPSYTAPTGLTAAYSDTLSTVTLPEGWAWVDGTQKVGNAGTNTFKATFTPADTDNYNVVENIDVTVTVAKADPTYTAPTGLTATYGDTLSTVTLPEGWTWADGTQSVGNVGENTFKANFTPTDTNYKSVFNVDVTVTVTAPAHTHSFTYSANGASITASCGEGCDITEGLTLTISAPTGDLTADGAKTFPAALSTGYNSTAFPDEYSISYTKDGEAFTGTPTDAGEYVASVTVGGATASVSYTVKNPVQLTDQPTNASGVLGRNVTFRVTATGTGLTYQWYMKKANESSFTAWNRKTSASVSTPVYASWNNAQFYCVVTDVYGNSVTSETVTLTVDFRITSQPSDVTAAVGENVTFTVRASGTGLTYQWYMKKANESSFTAWNKHTSASVSTPVYASWNGAKFYCVVTDASGNSDTSETVTLTVDFRITSQPSDVTAAVGENVTFTVRASGTGLTYQWYFKKANDSSFTAWNRKTYASVSTPVYASWNGAKFYCVVTDANGNSVQSETVTLTVDFRITSQPSDVTAAVGENVTFNVKASGNGLTYQWYFKKANDSSFTAWNRKTYASVSTPVYKSWNGAQFYCVVTDASGKTATSDIVTLTVG